MENQERMGTVYMKAFDALKKGCEENSINRVITFILPKFEKILGEKIKIKEQIPMFNKETKEKYLKQDRDLLEELKEEREDKNELENDEIDL